MCRNIGPTVSKSFLRLHIFRTEWIPIWDQSSRSVDDDDVAVNVLELVKGLSRELWSKKSALMQPRGVDLFIRSTQFVEVR